MTEYTYTVFLKMPDDPPGVYSEEVDVTVARRSTTLAKRAAVEAIETEDLDRQLRPARVVYRPTGWWL